MPQQNSKKPSPKPFVTREAQDCFPETFSGPEGDVSSIEHLGHTAGSLLGKRPQLLSPEGLDTQKGPVWLRSGLWRGGLPEE